MSGCGRGRVEDGRVACCYGQARSHPAHQIRTPPISGIRLPTGFTASNDGMLGGQALEAQNRRVLRNDIECELGDCPRTLHLAIFAREETAQPVQRRLGSTLRYALPREPVAKSVGKPAETCSACRVLRGPWIDIVPGTRRSPICLAPLHTLLGRARTRYPFPVRLTRCARTSAEGTSTRSVRRFSTKFFSPR